MQSDDSLRTRNWQVLLAPFAVVAGFALLTSLTMVLNPNWVYTNPYNPPWFDPFVYLALFERSPEIIERHPTYYPANRIPFVALGYLFYRLPDPVWANLLFKGFLATMAASFLFAAVRPLFGWRPALLVSAMLILSPQALMSFGWDYIDGCVMMFSACLYALGVAVALRAAAGFYAFLFGLMTAFMLVLTLGSAPLIASAGFLALVLSWNGGRLNARFAMTTISMGILGALLGALLMSAVNVGLGGSFFVIQYQFETAIQLSKADSGVRLKDWIQVLPDGSFNAFWLGTLVVSLSAIFFDFSSLLKRARVLLVYPASLDENSAAMARFAVIGQFGIAALFMIVTTLVSLAVLAFWFYSSFLIIPALLAIAGIIAPALNTDRPEGTKLSFIVVFLSALALLAASVEPNVANFIQQSLEIRTLTPRVFWLAGIFIAGLLALLFFAQLKLPKIGLVAAASLFAIAHASTMTLPQLNSEDTRSRLPGFLASHEAREAYTEAFPDGDARFWFDRNLEPYGSSFFWGLRISTMSADKELWRGWQVFNFPELLTDEDGMNAGQGVVIFTTRTDVEEAAATTLASRGLKLRLTKTLPISHGDVAFFMYFGFLDPR